jgi:hypothetical protein
MAVKLARKIARLGLMMRGTRDDVERTKVTVFVDLAVLRAPAVGQIRTALAAAAAFFEVS